VASSTVLVTLQPLFVVTGGLFFFKEKISRKSFAGIALALTGSVLIGINDFRIGGVALFGDLLAFSGAFFVAVYFLIGRSLRSRLSLFPYVFLV
jgi:drug/metabolite transporter (DMT)-like permease